MAISRPDRYSTNQFYNIAKAGEQTTPYGDSDNPQFLWPSPYLRNASADASIKVQRGYMRLISEVLGGDTAAVSLGKRRFHFQFNPETLTRSVTARNDVHLWMNQDPAQFTQPIPGDANFSFEIILNREAEVVSSSYKNRNGVNVKVNKAAAVQDLTTPFPQYVPGESRSAITSSYDPSSVTDIGVLADLLVFDQIIGQGVNRDLITALVSRSQDIAKLADKKTTDANANKDEGDKQPVIDFDPNKATNYLQGAVGNSAFLISQPVRVVFSSLFMVEGFVTATNVVFNKFNPAMVPTQCTININMQALYIGFARPKTFLTTVYSDAEIQLSNLDNENQAVTESLTSYGKSMVSKFIPGRGIQDVSQSISAQRILGGSELVQPVKVGVRIEPTDDLKEYAKNSSGTLTAMAVWKITYERTSGVPEEVGYVAGDELYLSSQITNLSLPDISEGGDTVIWLFSKESLPNFFEKKWDQTDGAIYKSQFYVVYTISDGATTVNTDEWAYAEKTHSWNESVILSATLQKRTNSSNALPSDIKAIVGLTD